MVGDRAFSVKRLAQRAANVDDEAEQVVWALINDRKIHLNCSYQLFIKHSMIKPLKRRK